MKNTQQTKIMFFTFASAKDNLSNLPQDLEYLIIDKLKLDDVLNFPIGLKELHIGELIRDNYYFRYHLLNLDVIIKDRFFKIPFGCKIKLIKFSTGTYFGIENCKVSKKQIKTLKAFNDGCFSSPDLYYHNIPIYEFEETVRVKFGKRGLKSIRLIYEN